MSIYITCYGYNIYDVLTVYYKGTWLYFSVKLRLSLYTHMVVYQTNGSMTTFHVCIFFPFQISFLQVGKQESLYPKK